MRSRLDYLFRRDFSRLPVRIQRQARLAYRRFQKDPSYRSLEFKAVHPKLPYWSVRINDSYRAVGVRKTPDEMIWFFIGSHAEYDRLLSTL